MSDFVLCFGVFCFLLWITRSLKEALFGAIFLYVIISPLSRFV